MCSLRAKIPVAKFSFFNDQFSFNLTLIDTKFAMQKKSIIINNTTFAKHKEYLDGKIQVADCARLVDWLQVSEASLHASPEANVIAYQLRGDVNTMGQQTMHLALDAHVTAICQRCMGAMPMHVQLSFNYLISYLNEEVIQENDEDNLDDVDVIEANQAMDLLALIEDELILAIPMAPLHEFNCTELNMQSGEKPNPFAVLKGLLKE